MRVGLWLVLLLLAGACAATNKHKEKHHPKHHHTTQKRDSDAQQQPAPQDIGSINVFETGRDYCFDYKSQISSGYAPRVSSQRAITRMQSTFCISVPSLDHCVLRMNKIKIGQWNEDVNVEEMGNPAQILRMEAFQKLDRNTTQLMREKLELPVEFSYIDGSVERLQFSGEDVPFSKNVKKAVLNMLQMNMKAGAQQQESEEQMGQAPEEQSQRDQFATAFTVMENTLEGECPTTYTVHSESSSTESQDSAQLNVTKSINFHRCQTLVDVAYGYQFEPMHASEWPVKSDSSSQSAVNTPYAQQEKPDTRVVIPKEKLDRSTTIRVVLSKNLQNGQRTDNGYGIERVELLSEYLVKSSRAESNQAMQTIAVAEITFTNSKEVNNTQTNIARQSAKEETLIYNADEEAQEKEFFMFGDTRFGPDSTPFPSKDAKVFMAKAEKHLRLLVEEFSKEKIQRKGSIEGVNAIEHFEKLVALMRMSAYGELMQLDEKAKAMDRPDSTATSNSFNNTKAASDLFLDALAVAATRNTVVLLEQKIKELATTNQAKAVQLLKVLGRGAGLPAISDKQVEAILGLCKSNEITESGMLLKQSCWLTFGTMVGELNMQRKKAELLKDTKTPMKASEEQVEDHKFDLYKDVLFGLWKKAASLYEKVLALKCIGNAGLKASISQLKPIIDDRAQPPIVRINAIDALRRMRHQVSARRIQSIVLPIYQNTKAQSEVRMSAFSMVMQTRPSNAIIDQIVFTMNVEKSQDVQTFVYSSIKAASLSPVSQDQELAKNLKTALKLVRVNEEQQEAKHMLSSSRRWINPFYSQDQQEGAFLSMVNMFSPDYRQNLPSHMSIGLDTYFNGQYNRNSLKLVLCQKDIEQLTKEIFDDSDDQSETPTGNRQGSQSNRKPNFFSAAAEKLRSLFSKLSIKGRSNQTQEEEDVYQAEKHSPHLLISARMNDVDVAMIPLNMDLKEGETSQLKEQLKQAFRNLISSNDDNKRQVNSAVVINSRASAIPTSVGLSLRMTQSMYLIGQLTTRVEQERDQVKVKFHPNLNWVQVQKMEVRSMAYRSGVRSTRAVSINLPIDATIDGDYTTSKGQKRTKFNVKVPQQLTRLASVFTLPTTYLKRVIAIHSSNENQTYSQTSGHQQVKTVRDEQLESYERPIHSTLGQKSFLGVPIKVHGHCQSPRKMLNLKEWLKVIMTGDNHISVDLNPQGQDSESRIPQEISFTLSADMFRATTDSPTSAIRPHVESFYQKDDSFAQRRGQQEQDEDDDDDDDDSNDTDEYEMSQGRRSNDYQQQRKRNFHTYLEKMGGGQQRNYQHTFQAWMETIGGGGSPRKASAKIDTVCDSRMRACQATFEAKRSPLQNEDWTMKAQVMTLYPEYVSDVEELLDSSNQQQQKFFCHAEAKWGQDGQPQEIQLNIQGQASQMMLQSIRSQQDQPYEGRRRSSKSKKTRRPFIDQYQMVADYKLQPQAKYFFREQLEALKARNFWNTESRILTSQQSSDSSSNKGQLECSFSIDRNTGRAANVTIQTPTQVIKIRPMELALKMRPMPLVRAHGRSHHQSTGELFGNPMEEERRQNRAQCKVGPKTVDTFDGVAYKAPMSKCYTVLAKDCGSEEKSAFAVLMRSKEDGGEDRKLKVLTPNQEISVEPHNQNGLRIRVGENSYEVAPDNQLSQEDEQKLRQQGVEVDTDYQGRQMVIVDVEGVAVKFNGKTAKIQIDEDFKEKQCGLCGNYNDDQEDELRNNDNELEGNVKRFHRSYALKSLKDGECQDEEHRDFYENQPSSAFGRQNQEESQMKPVERTVTTEYNHKVCFSLRPVKQCPEGRQPTQQEDEQSQQLQKRVKVPFTCINRQSIEAKRIRKVVRRSGVADLAEYQTSFVEEVVVPENCVQY